MKKRLTALFLAVALVFALLPTAIFFANAAGDTMQTATPINLNTSYAGTISSTNTADYYKFTLSTSGRVNVRITAYIYRTNYYIYDAKGNAVWEKTWQYWNSISEEYNLDENVDLTSGTYYFAVEQGSGTGDYNFMLSFTSANESFEETSGGLNNSIATASGISIGTIYLGQIACNDAKDIYKFTLSTSGRVNVRITAYIYRTNYYIYDAKGNAVWEKTWQYWNSTSEEYNLDENVDLTSGTYYFAIEQGSGTGNYNFSIGESCTTGHSWDTGKVKTAASCTENGVMIYTCKVCGQTKEETIPALGHNYIYRVTKVPTTGASGTLNGDCSRCNATTTANLPQLNTTDYTYSVVKAATCTAAGIGRYTWRTTTYGNFYFDVTTNALGHNYKNGVCTACGAKDPNYKPPVTTNPFRDVKSGAFYYDAVLWAVNAEPQVTSGTSATTFSPNDTCTRAQVVTFLWRAKGCPEPKSANNPFRDVKQGEYYYKAVLWAVENDITAGTSATTFSPNEGCTRAQVVTFLWRTEGEPKPTSSANPFKDVTGGYYYDAVLWAVEKKITAGTSATTFSPDNTCTRGQIVTFLYRAFA